MSSVTESETLIFNLIEDYFNGSNSENANNFLLTSLMFTIKIIVHETFENNKTKLSFLGEPNKVYENLCILSQ